MTYQAIIHDSHIGRWRAFGNPIEILQSQDVAQVKSILNLIEEKVQSGLWAVGFISYEASPAFESSAAVLDEETFPKIWFALFTDSQIIDLPKSRNNFYLGPWNSEISKDSYIESITKIKDLIKRGDTYQANFTFRQSAFFAGDPLDCFLALIERQSTNYGAYLECEDFSICSASPELFFTKEGSKILAKPMKGTAPRGLETQQDIKLSEDLKKSEKDRSENVMIVDMLRNDLSRIATNDSVKPLSLFDVEKFETLWQMTSTIEANSDRSISEILQALFPCASITGAPKCNTMKILADLEQSPRKIYTGAIGFLSPGDSKQAQFNVAIRTLVIDHINKQASYGVGSGIVWDSDSSKEYSECLLKAKATPNSSKDFALLETMLWSVENNFVLLEQHLDRMQSSAAFFSFNFDRIKIKKYLKDVSSTWQGKLRVRLLLSTDGTIKYESFEFNPSELPLKLDLAHFAINSKDIYLLHKTTERSIYKAALSQSPGHDDVILHNEHGQVTETCIGNLAYRIDKIWYTPTLSCGMLNGVFRQKLLQEGKLQERNLLVTELSEIKEIAVLNSVRGWCPAKMEFNLIDNYENKSICRQTA